MHLRQRLVLPSLAFLAALAPIAFCALSGCGGSSSETPPPLQPDPKGFRYASTPPRISVADSDAGAMAPMPNELDEQEKPRAPARSTWGAAKPGH
jgi:hypothetical protein